MVYIGLDPGKKGGLALIYSNGSVYVEPLTNDNLRQTMAGLSGFETRCALEKVHAMPKQGVASTFTFGEGYGYIKGVLESFGISYQEIQPERWKKEFGLNSDKAKSIEVCKRLFPNVSLKATERCRVDSDGLAESLLLAEYARRKL